MWASTSKWSELKGAADWGDNWDDQHERHFLHFTYHLSYNETTDPNRVKPAEWNFFLPFLTITNDLTQSTGLWCHIISHTPVCSILLHWDFPRHLWFLVYKPLLIWQETIDLILIILHELENIFSYLLDTVCDVHWKSHSILNS